jgi:hypothetical protein
VKKLLASYRWRRRLAWLTGLVLVVAAVVGAIVLWPNTAPNEPRGPSNVPAYVEKEPKAVRLKASDKKDALKVVTRFIYTAVARKNIDRSWELAAPELRQGFTRKQWDSGNMPVVPFPAQSARWRLEYSDDRGVGFSIALFPTPGSQQRAQVFLVGLHTLGAGKRRHWVVDNWQAAPSQGLQSVSGGGGGVGSVLEQTSPGVNRLGRGQRTESAAWLLLPLGLLSLVIFIPLGVLSVNWYRGHRAERALLRS